MYKSFLSFWQRAAEHILINVGKPEELLNNNGWKKPDVIIE
jgi:hypothetical protein